MGRIIDYLNDKQHLNKVLRISAICCAAALVMLLSVMIWTGTNSGKKAEFVPPAFDQSAVDGEPTVPDDAGYTPLRVEQGYMFYVCGSIKYTNGGADVYLTADCKYHEFQDADGRIGLIDIDHWISERHARDIFRDILSPLGVACIQSQTDKTPIQIYK